MKKISWVMEELERRLKLVLRRKSKKGRECDRDMTQGMGMIWRIGGDLVFDKIHDCVSKDNIRKRMFDDRWTNMGQ